MRWERVAVAQVAQINPRPDADDRPEASERVSFVPMASVSELTLSIERPEERMYADVAKGFTQFKRGDMIVAKITPCFENGKMARADGLPHRFGVGSTEFHVLRPSHQLDGGYLFHMLRAPWVRRAGAMKMKGAAGQRRVPAEFFAELEIPLPPLAEQKRIAGILDAADALRAKRREALAQLDALLQSTFLDMFGDPVTNPMGWARSRIGDLGDVITGNTPARKCSEYYGDAIEWIKSDNINDPSFTLTNAEEGLSQQGRRIARIAPKGSVLVTCIAGSRSCIGNAAIADREVAFNQQINAFVPGKRILLWYAFGIFLMGKDLVQRASTNSMKGMVSKSAFAGITVTLPPLDLQHRFAAIVESAEQQKARMRAHLAELDALFASLQSRAFSGTL
ncbi:restriction endonuclease subunit S [Thioalkalivibrio paradoxus]|uniref:Restriction modification system, type I n=1 Tax=Thioalkalivibrio paradoxus ARh 1 TaxID=713585 RepID=W0DN91_9GAMM|nr:restriction endonuclease subunit S [Thioalkalivibrio paradoxus]AHE98697.1 restriction modification system, type I [Thioalkalivibrio paradoxus ARh 1]